MMSEGDDDPSTPLLEAALKFIVMTKEGVIVRDGPGVGAKRTGLVLHHSEIFEVDDIVTLTGKKKLQHWDFRPVDEACFLRLRNGAGWVIDKNIVTEENIVEEHDPHMTGCEAFRFNARLFFASRRYEFLIMFIIVANAIMIGLEIDHKAIMAYHNWLIVNTTFAAIYLVEMVTKFLVFRCSEFFRSKWNIFDVIVMLVTLIGDAYMLQRDYATDGHSQKEWFLALIPVLRLLRLLRIAKLFHELRLLVKSFVGSLAALAWIGAFAILWFYICACVSTVFLGREEMLKDGDVENAGAFRQKFDTIPHSMYTLFEVMTLEAFTDVVSPLVRHRPWLLLFLLVFVFVTAFFLLNLVTAVVVKRTMTAQKEIKEAQGDVEEDKRETQIADMYASFLRLNDGHDIIKVQNFDKFQDDEKVQKAMENLGWDAKFLNSLIVMVNRNKLEDEVSLKEMNELWITYGQPLDTPTLLQFQMQIARRLDMQEKLCIELLEKEKRVLKLLEKLEGGHLGPMAAS